MIADFFDYLDEAERVRSLAIGSIETAIRIDSQVMDELTTSDDERQAAWERVELARHEVANGHPHLNALTLVGMFGNLDGLVESLAPSAREMLLDSLTQRAMAAAIEKVGAQEGAASDAARESIDESAMDAVTMAVRATFAEQLPKVPRMERTAPEWYERVLTPIGLGAPPDRPLPVTLVHALGEISALRDVLVHRAGRVDEKAIAKCGRLEAQLGFTVGQFVRIDRSAYRRYSAAIRCYGLEVMRRILMHSRIEFELDLAAWRDQHYILA